MLSTRILEGSDWAEQLREPWRELAAASKSTTPFQTWEWQTLWHKHLRGNKRPHVWTLWEGQDLVGLFPMVRSTGMWRVLRSMGCGPSDYLHPICRLGYEGRVAESLASYLATLPNTDLVDLHQVRETNDLVLSGSPNAESWSSVLNQATCLVLDLPKTFDTYVAELSKSLRYDVKRLDKFTGKEKDFSIDTVSAENAREGMEKFFDCHVRRWRKRGQPGAFLSKSVRRFHAEWANVAAKNDWLRLSLLKSEDRVVGAIYAMTLGDAYFFYQSGFDPVKGSISPGTLLVAHTIRQAIEEGRARFDFLRGDEPYKRRWKPQHTYRNLRVLVAGNGLLGRSAMAWNGAGFKIESRLRARLEGRRLL